MRKLKYVVFMIMVMMGLTGCGGTKVDMTDYISVEFSGVNGDGKAVCNVDTVKLEKDLAGDDDGEISMEEFEKLAWITQFEMGVSYELDKNLGLSNGDKVTVTLNYDQDIAKKNKVKVTGKKKEFTVEGLKEAIEVDAFASSIFNKADGVVLEYSGVAPMAYLDIQNNCKTMPASLITYRADKTYELKNGDEIKITAQLSERAINEGYVLKETEKTIKVKGLNAYVTNLSQLNKEDKAAVLEKASLAFNVEADDNIDFYNMEDGNVDMSNRSTQFSNFSFVDDMYETKAKDVLVIPFTVDTTGEYYWIGREYSSTPIRKTYTGVNGFITVKRLKVDAEGKLIANNDVTYEVGKMFETKEQMKKEIHSVLGI